MNRWTAILLVILFGLGGPLGCAKNEDKEAETTTETVVTPEPAAVVDVMISSGTPSVAPTTVPAGGSVTLSAWTVKNQGTLGAGEFDTGYYLSFSATVGAGGVLVGGNHLGDLGAGSIRNWGASSLTIPATTVPGAYYLCIWVDCDNELAESNEANNWACAALTVTMAAKPNLSVSASRAVNPASVVHRGQVTLSNWTVQNQGTADAGPFQNVFISRRTARLGPPMPV